MKKLKYIITNCLVVVLLISSCDDDFLVKNPPDSLTADGFFNSAERAELGTNAIYKSVQGAWQEQLYRLGSVLGDDMVLSNTQPLEYNNFAYDASLPEFQETWTYVYEGINRANLAIARVPEVEMDNALKNRYIGEAKFLRAHLYFQLVRLWGGVPLATTPEVDTNEALIPRSTESEVYDQIIQDLQNAIEVLPYKSGYSEENLGRATWGAAKSLLGKVYLYRENFEQAEQELNDVIISDRYELVDDFEQVLHRNNEHNVESIFEITYAATGEIGGNYNSGWLPAVNGGTGSDLPSQRSVNAYEDGDPRLKYSIFREGDTFAPHISDELATFDSDWSASNYAMKKGMLPITYVNGNDRNYVLIRYADVLLMYAEAANELNRRDAARNAVNRVRQRPSVDMPELIVSETNTYQGMFNAIVQERHSELMFEYARFHDLRRWGLAEEVLGDLGYTSRHDLLPIPQLEMDINPELDQNPGWGQN